MNGDEVFKVFQQSSVFWIVSYVLGPNELAKLHKKYKSKNFTSKQEIKNTIYKNFKKNKQFIKNKELIYNTISSLIVDLPEKPNGTKRSNTTDNS